MTGINQFSENNLTVNTTLLLYVLYSYWQHVFIILSGYLWVLNIFNTHAQETSVFVVVARLAKTYQAKTFDTWLTLV